MRANSSACVIVSPSSLCILPNTYVAFGMRLAVMSGMILNRMKVFQDPLTKGPVWRVEFQGSANEKNTMRVGEFKLVNCKAVVKIKIK